MDRRRRIPQTGTPGPGQVPLQGRRPPRDPRRPETDQRGGESARYKQAVDDQPERRRGELMGAPSSGKRSQLDAETVLLWVFITVVVLGVGSVTGAVHLGSILSNDGQKLPANPF